MIRVYHINMILDRPAHFIMVALMAQVLLLNPVLASSSMLVCPDLDHQQQTLEREKNAEFFATLTSTPCEADESENLILTTAFQCCLSLSMTAQTTAPSPPTDDQSPVEQQPHSQDQAPQPLDSQCCCQVIVAELMNSDEMLSSVSTGKLFFDHHITGMQSRDLCLTSPPPEWV